MNNTSILIAEGDRSLNNQLAGLLRLDGHQVDQCFEGNQGLEQAIAQKYQLIVVNDSLPKRDGFSLLRVLRKTSQTPVIMLTNTDSEALRIQGLQEGADDSIAKPFSTTELRLRIDAVLRRTQAISYPEQTKCLELDGLHLDRINQFATANGSSLDLTPIQFKLLWSLVLNRGDILSKAYLYQTVLKRALGKHDRSLDMHMSRVRRKLIDASWFTRRLQTIHGKGYCIE